MECMLTPRLLHCYYAFILPILEYCSPVWGSAASSHFRLLDRQIHAVSRLFPDQILKPLNHCRCVAGMCMLYKIHINPKHCLYGELPPACQRVRHTHAAAMAHPCELEVLRCRTSQFGRCFMPAHVCMWNDLPSSCCGCCGYLPSSSAPINPHILIYSASMILYLLIAISLTNDLSTIDCSLLY